MKNFLFIIKSAINYKIKKLPLKSNKMDLSEQTKLYSPYLWGKRFPTPEQLADHHRNYTTDCN
jgi:hypothetical protein